MDPSWIAGLVLAALIVGIAAFLLLRRYRKRSRGVSAENNPGTVQERIQQLFPQQPKRNQSAPQSGSYTVEDTQPVRPIQAPASPTAQAIEITEGRARIQNNIDPARLPSHILERVHAMTLLKQVNTHVLKEQGLIKPIRGGLRLIWAEGHGGYIIRSITISVLDGQTISINGRPCPASTKGVQRGLLLCIKMMQGK